MRTFKLVDLIVQACMILAFAIAWMWQPDFKTAVLGYFVVGGWQLLVSMIVHWIARYDMRFWSHRTIHTFVMAVLAAHGVLGIVSMDLGFAMLYVLLFASPFLALWYWVLCFLEWRRIGKSALATGS